MKHAISILHKTVLARLLTLALTLTLVLTLGSVAQASYFPGYDITSLETYLNGQNGNQAASFELYTGPLDGLFSVTALAYEAGHTNEFYGQSGPAALFSNAATGAFGSFVTGVDLGQAFYKDVADNETFLLTNADAVRFYKLTAAWVAPSLGINLDAGTLIFGLNDSWDGDKDYDDLIMAASPTPIPGTVWLLCSGLLGLVALRRATANI